MKRVLSDEEPLIVSDLSNVSIDVIECIMRVMGVYDIKNMSLGCKRFYEASRRKSIVARISWTINLTSYLKLYQLKWFIFIVDVRIESVQFMLLLRANGLQLNEIMFLGQFNDGFEDAEIWPKTLKTLKIISYSNTWDYSIDGVLPEGLETLEIDSNAFNRPLTGLPTTLKCLIVSGDKFSQEIIDLPDSVEDLVVLCDDENPLHYGLVKKLPKSLKHLDLSIGWHALFDSTLIPYNIRALRLASKCIFGYLNVDRKHIKEIQIGGNTINFP